MEFYFKAIFLIFIFQKINSFLIISMIVKKVDDCIREIELDDEIILYKRDDDITCEYSHGHNLDYNIPIFEPIPYEIGQKIKIVIGDKGGTCGFRMEIFINNNTFKNDDKKFWDCDNCNDFDFNYNNNKLLNCYFPDEGEKNNYSFYFNINSLEELDFDTSEYFYYFNNKNNIYISTPDFNNTINLIDLFSENILYAKNSDGDIITPFYNYIYYKLSFDELKTHKGKFIGSNESNNDRELDDNTYYRIFENKNLRYELSDEEKNNYETFIRFKIGIYNNQKKLISELKDFNFVICLEDHLSCDNENPLKCSCGSNEQKIEDKLIENLEKGFTSENYNTSELENGKDSVIKTEKMTITLTTTDNQKSNDINDTSTKVNIGPCEDILRSFYNISEDKKLYMKKIDVDQEGMNIPKIEYDIYCKLNGTNLIKLNKSHCSNVKAELSVHVIIKESIDKLNTSSDYYNDICYTSTSDSGTDILLSDRKNEYINGNKAVCQDGCDFIKYDYDTLKALCSCDIKESSSSFSSMNIDKDKLFKNFINIRNIANINILKCYKTLFSKNGIKRNIGSLIIIPIIIFHFICILLFYSKNLNIIQDKIKDIIFGITNWKLVKEDKKAKKLIMKIEKAKLRKEQINLTKIIHNKIKFKAGDKYTMKIPDSNLNLTTKNNNLNPPKKEKRKSKIVVVNNYLKMVNNNIQDITSKNNSVNSTNKLFQKELIIKKTREIMTFNDEELNQLSYKLALKYDDRTYCEYYYSLIKTRHNLIFSFYYSNDYNSKIVKIDLFFIDFVINFTVNALFFDDNTMHKIYEEKGKFQFIYQLPQIIYSTIISSVLDYLLKFLALSEDYILAFKKKKVEKNLEKRNIELNKKLKIIFMLYFIISSIFLVLFWYYISMFCAIYKNTQIHLIKDTLISLGISLLYPFGLYLLPGFFRIPSLSNKHKKKKCLYNMSKLFQMI